MVDEDSPSVRVNCDEPGCMNSTRVRLTPTVTAHALSYSLDKDTLFDALSEWLILYPEGAVDAWETFCPKHSDKELPFSD